MHIYDNRLKIENIKALDTFVNRVADTGALNLVRVDTIDFKNVSFTYPSATAPALDGVSFLLRKEEKVALVGLNGSGKSTMIKLLLRVYDQDTGTIHINGHGIKEYKLSELHANFSVYFQEMCNYSFTLRENLTFADDGQEDDAATIEAALLEAYCGDMINESPKELDAGLPRFFDPEGIELSGGQHQKLALARTFYRRHTALVLDEPSSNLDPMAEHHIFESLRTFTDDKMTIFTSHRLSNVALADRIIVLESGRVIEDGTQRSCWQINSGTPSYSATNRNGIWWIHVDSIDRRWY